MDDNKLDSLDMIVGFYINTPESRRAIIKDITRWKNQLLTKARISEIERLLGEHQFFAPTHEQLTNRLVELKTTLEEEV